MSRIRTPKQQRGIETRKQIIKTAFKLFAEKGIHGTNSTEIAQKAGISIGSFYSYFKNKKVLLLEMLEGYVEEHYKMVWRKLDGFNLDELDRDKINAIISMLRPFGIKEMARTGKVALAREPRAS